MTDSGQIYTHYYKLAHVASINYATYTAKEQVSDQLLLELELQIRSQHPGILLAYYNKCLYHFSFSHWDSLESLEGYPIKLLSQTCANVDMLANPSRAVKKAEKKPSLPEDLAYASLSFLKAVKKAVVYNLSAQQKMHLFGNYVVAPAAEKQYGIVQVDPVLLTTGDLLVGLTQRNSLPLFPTSVLSIDKMAQDIGSFVVYVVPSGLRCHLYDQHNLAQTFSKTPPKSAQNLLRLLKLSTGVERSENDVTWVKLIPNLQHLNNQTSKISQFVHDVDNKKFIVWPWELCILQFGTIEQTDESPPVSDPSDPFSLIHDFISFSIDIHDHESQPMHVQPESGGISEPNVAVHEIFGEVPNMSNPASNRSGEESKDETKEEVKMESPQVDNPEDDLFGESSDSETQEKRVETMEPGDLEVEVTEPEQKVPHIVQETIEDTEMVEKQEKPTKTQKSSVYLSIPKDEMISQKFQTPDSYIDPGAPPPIIPTPIMMQPKPTSSSNAPNSRDLDSQGYAFSPIVFNPKIQSNIDAKYGRGGKFFVEREDSSGPESEARKPRLRETSVYNVLDSERGITDSERGANEAERGMSDSQRGSMHEKAMHDAQRAHMDSQRGMNDAQKGIVHFDSEKSFNLQDPEKGPIFHESVQESEKSLLNKRENPDNILYADIGFENGNNEAEDFDVDADMDMESDDESDEDEEDHFSDLKMSPLKLNTHAGDILNQVAGIQPDIKATSLPSTTNPNFNTTSYSDSPSVGHIRSEWRADSPMASGSHLVDHGSFISSPNLDTDMEVQKSPEKKVEKKVENGPNGAENDKTQDESPSVVDESVPNVAESSNCLPLILRSINVFSIPNTFLLRDCTHPTSSDFNMDFDDDDDDIKSGDGLTVKKAEIDSFLRCLMLNLVFDMGSNKFLHMRLQTPSDFDKPVFESPTDGNISKNTSEAFFSAYPLSYRVTLSELMEDPEKKQGELTFLEEISDGAGSQPPLVWDSFRPETPPNQANFQLYKDDTQAKSLHVDDNIFLLNEVRSKIAKSGHLVNFNFVGLRFWRYLHFSPVGGPKKFQVLMIAENDNLMDYGNLYDTSNLGFLELLRCNFKENQLGSVKKLHLQSIRLDLESVSNGLLLVEKHGDRRDYYGRVNRKLRNLAEMIKVDLITKANRFEFDRPLLLLFLNFDESIKAMSQIAKICRNFGQYLKDRQLPLVQVFQHILPWDFIGKKTGFRCSSRYIPELKLSKLALSLYNKCPDVHEKNVKTDTWSLYTQLVKSSPSSINFKFLNKENAINGASFHDDLFLHVAYERSVDKNWISAAWSDPLGIVTHVRSWCCFNTRDVGSIIVDIWDISNDLFGKLKDAMSLRTCGSDKKRFLVLTRISSIIPDDELIFWKRLTAKYKEVSLIVLSTSRLPKYLFSSHNSKTGFAEKGFSDKGFSGKGFTEKGASEKPGSFSDSGYAPVFNDNTASLVQSPVNASTFNSPNQFLNAAANFFSPDVATPVDMSEADVVVKDPRFDIMGVIPKMPLPSFNSPTRLGMRIGYLIKSREEAKDGEGISYMVFEVTLLSCSAYWSLNSVMKLLLNQYKNLIVLNEVLGVVEMDHDDDEQELRRLVPWHINAVVKTLDYLVHVQVED